MISSIVSSPSAGSSDAGDGRSSLGHVFAKWAGQVAVLLQRCRVDDRGDIGPCTLMKPRGHHPQFYPILLV